MLLCGVLAAAQVGGVAAIAGPGPAGSFELAQSNRGGPTQLPAQTPKGRPTQLPAQRPKATQLPVQPPKGPPTQLPAHPPKQPPKHPPHYRPPTHRPWYGWNGRYYHGGPYRYPPGYAYRHWSRGQMFPLAILTTTIYFTNYAVLGLDPPPYGYVWVRYGPDILLIRLSTGEVMDGVYGVIY